MGIQVALNHRTEYRYDKSISLGPQTIQLRPAPYCRTPILTYSLNVTPADHLLNWQLDPFSNYLARLIFPNKTDELIVDVNLTADLTPINPFDFFLEPGYEKYPFTYSPQLTRDLASYLAVETGSPLLNTFYQNFHSEHPSSDTVSLLLDLNRKIRDDIAYVIRLEPGVQSCEETIQLRSGSCRDSSWLLVQMLRKLGIAARFVTGYLIQLADESPSGTLVRDSADLHAWAEAYLPGAGWIGMDPTSGLLTAEGHIPLASTPNAAGSAPIGGTMEPANTDFSFSMSVRRLNEEPGLTKPFSDHAWASIEAVAGRVDAALTAEDVRLTMGGEPTFVGIDDPESPQWNIDALGDIKRTRGLELIRRIRDRVAPGGLLHYGQGKWYPGEPLPRWALSCYWRKDNIPVWDDANLIALENSGATYSTADALTFAKALTRRLEVSQENLLPVFNPNSSENEPAGYILPIRRRQPEGVLRWSSQLWFPRPERFTLLSGDSPIGFRLPTEAMPWVAPDELVYEYEEEDPTPSTHEPTGNPEKKAKLPAHPRHQPELFAVEPQPDPLAPLSSTAETATVLIRTAVCIEAREGRLCVFLPFSSELADYLDMITAVEDTALHLGVKIWVEGYTPPSDSRLRFFSVTPDPGVLEVNLPPASNWKELKTLNTLLFEEATTHRLTAEKFNYDGGHVSTGGGSHIVIGGATVLDSPFLRRPGLLRSMVAFWQNHPSLSYLFSGIYVGPTSQYPRVDEARTDALYELEVAFANLPETDCPPWVIDGLFRNLLADITGNTHRAEFCIDKLYPPEGQGLQLGLLELRAFEMPPHLKMGLLQIAAHPRASSQLSGARHSLRRQPHPLGRSTARPLHAPALCPGRPGRCSRFSQSSRLRLRTQLVPCRKSTSAFPRIGAIQAAAA